PTLPESRAAFAQYCYHLASQLRGKVRYFELWNEPNADGFWRPRNDPKAYAALVKEAYPAIKRGNPAAVVCGISLSGMSREWIKAALDAGAYDFMDVVSVHPYSHPRSAEENGTFDQLEEIRTLMKNHGAPKPVWFTEIGWPTNLGGGISEDVQARFLSRIYLLSFTKPYLETVFWYWLGPDGPDANWAEDRFGLLHQDFSLKPSALAYHTMTRLLRDKSFVEERPLAQKCHDLVFRGRSETLHALWCEKGTRMVEAETTAPIQMTNLYGDSRTFVPRNGRCFFTLSEEPIYLCSSYELAVRDCPAEFQSNIWRIEGDSFSIARGQTVHLRLDLHEGWTEGPTTPTLEFSTSLPAQVQVPFLLDGAMPWTHQLQVHSHAPLGQQQLMAFVLDHNAPFARLTQEIEISEPLVIHAMPTLSKQDGHATLQFAIENATRHEVSGRFELTASGDFQLEPSRGRFVSVQPGRKFLQTDAISPNDLPDRVYEMTAKVNLNGGVQQQKSEHFSFTTSSRRSTPPSIDGRLNDWPKTQAPIRLGREDQIIASLRKWGGPDDSSARVYTSWDADWFYIAAEVRDNLFSEPCAGPTIYNNDGIEVYFDTDHDGDQDVAYYNGDDYQYGLFPSNGADIVYSWQKLGGPSGNSKIKINRHPSAADTLSGQPLKGYIIEAAIPLAELGLKPGNGLHIGFNLALCDDDDPSSVHPFMQ
ncbi:MAG: sugar-binding protein, partial [bacterium]